MNRFFLEQNFFGQLQSSEKGFPEVPEGMRAAAVLIPLIERQGRVDVLFTLRSSKLKDHPGQISFPGGGVETADKNPAQTAVRETVEEIGVHSSQIELVGVMEPLATGTGFYITPAVGFLDPDCVYAPQTSEVEEVFELPFSFFTNPENHKVHPIIYQGKKHKLWAMPYNDRFVWGATAQILRNVYEMIALPACN